MNNKKLGTAFERRMCKILADRGYWVHFITPDSRGAQPFDIIAVKDGLAVAIECKTLDEKVDYFSINRIEENQRLAFQRWVECGNLDPIIAVEYGERIVMVKWRDLKHKGRVYLNGA